MEGMQSRPLAPAAMMICAWTTHPKASSSAYPYALSCSFLSAATQVQGSLCTASSSGTPLTSQLRPAASALARPTPSASPRSGGACLHWRTPLHSTPPCPVHSWGQRESGRLEQKFGKTDELGYALCRPGTQGDTRHAGELATLHTCRMCAYRTPHQVKLWVELKGPGAHTARWWVEGYCPHCRTYTWQGAAVALALLLAPYGCMQHKPATGCKQAEARGTGMPAATAAAQLTRAHPPAVGMSPQPYARFLRLP